MSSTNQPTAIKKRLTASELLKRLTLIYKAPVA